MFNPSLTTIAQPTYEIGQKAAELLFESIQANEEGVVVEPRQIVLQSSLKIRESTGPAPQSWGAFYQIEKTRSPDHDR